MSTIPISLVPVAPTCAVLSGLFVLSQLFHPWVSWSRYICGLVYSFIYFGLIVTLTIWYWLQQPFSKLAMRLLLETCWLNSLGGQVSNQATKTRQC
ncbi:hypothetical protein BS50DRAFT_132868 [Corynespora cassiicola Philippines]|uniref:Uncharacterized protein n=1 Tax=Corynespora cassiicola Philippines TaxID=1448308 RepID=A0A2T2N0L4_CORCC|nr:hypothetical protein BS50DRAFT_132868 [Corynespora cassiicola Philippines]